jgi:hypothetical protein
MTHGTPSGYNSGCRCTACSEAHRIYCRQARARMAERAAAGDAIVPHGLFGYTNWRCRCEICTEAKKEHCRAYYASKRQQGAASP